VEDAEIVDLFFQRSEQAIPETAAKYQGLIFQISRNILENPQDAEECVNDTYLGLTEINFPGHHTGDCNQADNRA